MSCCKDCESNVPRVTVELAFDVTEHGNVCAAFKGKNLKLVSFKFVSGPGNNLEKQHYAKLTEHGDNKANITVYQQRLPFDELVMSIPIDTTTGSFAIRSFMAVSNQFVLELEADDEAPPEAKGYLDMGNGSYRVTTFKGARDLFGHLKLRLTFLDSYLNLYATHAMQNQPVLVVSSEPSAIMMTTPQHPVWKDDSLWQ